MLSYYTIIIQYYDDINFGRLLFFCLFDVQQSGQPQKGDHTKSDTVQTVFGSGLHRKLTAAPIQPRAKKTG